MVKRWRDLWALHQEKESDWRDDPVTGRRSKSTRRPARLACQLDLVPSQPGIL